MQDIVFSFDLLSLGAIFIIVFIVYYFFLKKQIFIWFDPLLIFVFFNSISVALVVYLYFFNDLIRLDYLLSFCFSIIAFVIGLNLGGRFGLPSWSEANSKFDNESVERAKHYSLIIDVFLVISLSIMLFSNLLLLIVKGTLPIFSSNPSEAKILLYTGGWGIIKRINSGLVYYILAVPFIKLFHPFIKLNLKYKLFYLLCIMTCVILIVSTGSKSSILIVLNILFAIMLLNKGFGRCSSERKKSSINIYLISKWAKYVFTIAVVVMFIVISLSGVETSLLDSFTTRLVASGDTFYFFYVFDIESQFHRTPMDYVSHIFNPLFAMLRLTSYEFPIGAYIIHYAIDLPLDAEGTFGPNAQHPVEGLIYFGKLGAPLYSLLVGYAISVFRVGLLHKIGPYPNCLALLLYVVFSSIIVSAATDVPLFAQMFFDAVLFGVFILIASFLVTHAFVRKS